MSDPQQPHTPFVVQSPGVIGFASDTVGALKSTPILLVMVLLNCTFIGAAAFYFRVQQDNVYKLVDKMLDKCLANPKQSLLPDTDTDADARPVSPPARPYSATPDHAIPKEGDG